jgi:hypothetical protein
MAELLGDCLAVSNLKNHDPPLLPPLQLMKAQGTNRVSRWPLKKVPLANWEEVVVSPQLETIDVSWTHNPRPIPGRHVKEGILLIPEKLNFTLRFEGFPMWILALDQTLVSEVIFLDWASPGEITAAMKVKGHNMLLLKAAIAHIGLSKVQFG